MTFNVNLLKFFSKSEIEQIARKTGFVMRKSAINGFNMLVTFTTGLLHTTDTTLLKLVTFLNNCFNIQVTPQALDERINQECVAFLRYCLEKVMTFSMKKIDISCELFSSLAHIFIIDSTNFDLLPSLKEIFKGSGGAASLSSMRIQLIYDYLSGKLYIMIGDTRTSDTKTLKEIVENNLLQIEGNALFLQDLGYFKTETFIAINDNGNFFLSKLKYNIQINDLQGNPIDLKKTLKGTTDSIDIMVNINGLICRLVGKRLPEEIVNERRRKANAEAYKKGRKISDEYRLFLSWAFLITNLNNKYSIDTLFIIYRIRWQIELIFKSWKSILKIHRIHAEKIYRVLCEVYGKLIIAIIISGIYYLMRNNGKQNFSYYKIFQYLKTMAEKWATNIIKGEFKHALFLKTIIIQLSRFCIKNKQKNKPTIDELLLRCEP